MQPPPQSDPLASMSSDTLAREIVRRCWRKQKPELRELLVAYKNKRNKCYQKFSAYISEELGKCTQIDFQASFTMLKALEEQTIQCKNGDSQIKAHAKGFTHFWIVDSRSKDEIENNKNFELVLNSYFEFAGATCEVLAEYVAQAAGERLKHRICHYLSQQLGKEWMSCQKSRQCCHLIHAADLYDNFEVKDLARVAVCGKMEEILSFFRGSNGEALTELCESYVLLKLPSGSKDIKKLIQSCRLDPFNFPQYIKTLNKKCLRYFLNTEPIYVTELKIAGRDDIIECLIEELLTANRLEEAIHFINRFRVKKFYHLRSNKKTYHPNFLIHCDRFHPTESIIDEKMHRTGSTYIQMSDFQLSEGDVVFVDETSWERLRGAVEEILQAERVGIDSENFPAFNAYEEKKIGLLQIAPKARNGDRIVQQVYLFDFHALKDHEEFRKWLGRLLCECKGRIVGHTTKLDVGELLKEMRMKVKVETDRLIDVQSDFKKKFPKDSKSSLEYMCEKMLRKKLSKFEQCSGWQNRPLRKAQMHYAALDAVLPLVLEEQLQ